MTPFAGVGVNTALYDAMLLARCLAGFVQEGGPDLKTLDGYIVSYERDMFAFAKSQQELTDGAMTGMMFTPGAPRARIESYILRFLKVEAGALWHPLLTVGVYTFYFFYKLFR